MAKKASYDQQRLERPNMFVNEMHLINSPTGTMLHVDTAAPTSVDLPGPASLWLDTSAKAVYYNSGTKASPTWTALAGSSVTLQQAFTSGQVITTASATKKLAIGDGTDTMYLYSTNASNMSFITTNAGTDLTIAPAGGDVVLTGTLAVSGTVTSTGNFTVGVTKLVVTATTGAVSMASGLTMTQTTGNAIVVNSNKFTVAADTGDTLVAGTLNVTGAATLGSVAISAIQPAAGNLAINGATGATTITIGNLSTGGITIADNVTLSQPMLISGTNALSFYDAALLISSSTDGQLDIDADVELELATATLDVNAGTAVTVDTAAFSIDGTSTSNVSVTGADLKIETLTSGTLDVNAVANLTVDAGGTVSIDGVGASNFTIATGNLSLITTGSGGIILNSVGVITPTSAAAVTWTHSGGAFTINSTSQSIVLNTLTSGDIDMDSVAAIDIDAGTTFDVLAAGAFSIDGTGASNVSAASGNLTIQTTTTGDIILNSVAAITPTSAAATTWTHSGGAWTLNSTSQAIALNTLSSGTLSLNSAGAIDIDAAAASAISVASANLTIETTTSGALAITSDGTLTLTGSSTVDLGADLNAAGFVISDTTIDDSLDILGGLTFANTGDAIALQTRLANDTVQDVVVITGGTNTPVLRLDNACTLVMNSYVLYGDDAANGNLILSSTSNGTKGFIGIATGEEGMKIGGTADRAGTVGDNALHIFDGAAAPAGSLANGASLYSAAGELYTMDATGNATLQTPHDDENMWVFHSKNTATGEVLHVDMERLLKAAAEKLDLSGFIQEYVE